MSTGFPSVLQPQPSTVLALPPSALEAPSFQQLREGFLFGWRGCSGAHHSTDAEASAGFIFIKIVIMPVRLSSSPLNNLWHKIILKSKKSCRDADADGSFSYRLPNRLYWYKRSMYS